MEKPYKFFALHNESGEVRYFNDMLFKPYQMYAKPYPWVIYEDIRYAQKLRLYNYLNGIKPIPFKPFEGTEIGKSISILNF